LKIEDGASNKDESGDVKGLYVKGKSDKGRNGKNKQKSKTTTMKSCYFCHKEDH